MKKSDFDIKYYILVVYIKSLPIIVVTVKILHHIGQ